MSIAKYFRQKEINRRKKLHNNIVQLDSKNSKAHPIALRVAIEDIENAFKPSQEIHFGRLVDGRDVRLRILSSDFYNMKKGYDVCIEIDSPPERLFDLASDKRIRDFFEKDIHFDPVSIKASEGRKPKTIKLNRVYLEKTEIGYECYLVGYKGHKRLGKQYIMSISYGGQENSNAIQLFLSSFVYEHPQIERLINRFLKEGIELDYLDREKYSPSVD